MRLERAPAMLAAGKSCKAVALDLGYSDYALFSKQFKKVFGICPDEYKRRNGGTGQGGEQLLLL